MQDFLVDINRSKTLLRKIIIWNYKHVSKPRFVYALRILVAFLQGKNTVVLKKLTPCVR